MTFARVFLLAALMPFVAHAATEKLAQLEASVVDGDAKLAQELWKELAPGLGKLSRPDQGRFLVVQGLIQEDILRDIDAADQSFNRVIDLLGSAPEPTQALADAYYERAYIKYIRTNDTAVYCPDREKAVEITRKLNTREKLHKQLTALAFCYTDSPKHLAQGLAVLDEALSIAESLQLEPGERGYIYNATALLYRKSQLYTQAYEYSLLSFEQYDAANNWGGRNNQQHNLLVNAVGMGDLDKAEEHGKALLALADGALPEFKDFRFFAYLDNGLVAMARNDLPRAIEFFEQARGEEKNTQEGAFITANRANLASAYFQKGDTAAALRESAAVARMPGFANLDSDLKQQVQALQQYGAQRPVTAMQTLLTLYRAQQKKQWDFLANAAPEQALKHNNRIRQYEKQLLENKVQIQQLKLDAQQQRQETTLHYLILAAVAALSLGLLAWVLWRSRHRFRTQAQTDSLTGIANRRHFFDSALQVARKGRHSSQVASVLVLDIDYFKLINDAHGHQAGDAAIRHVATLVTTCLREGDVFGRIGGEEFAALLPSTPEPPGWQVAERIRQAIEQTPLDHHGDRIPLTVSIGLMSGPLTGDNIETLIQCADKVMYRAKNSGRNRSLSHTDQFVELALKTAAG